MADITITGGGNVDNKNFYVDPNGDLWYDVLYEKIPTKPGDWTTAGKPLEAKRYPSGQRVTNLNGFNFTRSNYNPLAGATPSTQNIVGNTTSPIVTTRPTGVIPPPNTGPAIPGGTPANVNITPELVAPITAQEALSYNANAALSSFNIGPSPVSVAMPGSTINANYDSNPQLGNVSVQPGAAQAVFAPTRAVEFNPTTGGVEAGPAAQVRLAQDGTLRITPDTATEFKLGTGVSQAVNGDLVVSTGGVAVLSPNTEVVMEPGTSAALMPFAAGNTETILVEAEPAQNLNFIETTPALNSVGEEVIETTDAPPEYLENQETGKGQTEDGRLIGSQTNAQSPELDDDGFDDDEIEWAEGEGALLANDGIQYGNTGAGGTNKEESGIGDADTIGVADRNIATGSDGASPVPTEFLEKIVAKPNPFKDFATMTYAISLYLLDKPAYEKIMNQGIKSVAGLPLLIQSGGAAEDTVGTFGAFRDPNFHLDFYIDDIEIEGGVSGTSTQSVHNAFKINFRVKEPNGLTFLDSLHAAVKDHHLRKGFPADKINYAAQQYLMVIRFYGYDKFGRIVDGTTVSKTEPTSDTRAVSEKFIPFIFSGIKFTMAEHMIEYNCECAAIQSFFSQVGTHSAIPFNVELTGGTVASVLGIGGAGEGYSDDEFNPRLENNAINTKNNVTVYTGLANALNVESERAYGKEYAHKYIIEVEQGSEIGTKKIVVDPNVDKSLSAMPSDKSNPTAPNTDRVDKNQGRKSLPAGTSIIQAIELVVRESEFVKAQQNIEIDKRTGKPTVKAGAKNKVFQWFKVIATAVPRSAKINPQTMDYAYTITYTIKRYGVSDPKSPYFPQAYYRGVHKRYPYWFTGENTEIIDFRQDFNYLYYQQFGSEGLVNPQEINTIHVTKNFYMPRTNEASLGSQNKSSEPSSSVASILYSPADMASAELTIVGDPDWIAQSEIFYSPKVSKQKNVSNSPFMPDGSINYDASEVYFSIEYNTPADYQHTGLQNIGYNNPNKGVVDISGATATVVLAYRANTITTKLSAGQFIQYLKGTLLTWRDDVDALRQPDGSIGIDVDSNKRKAQQAEDDAFWANVDAEQAQLMSGVDPETVTFAEDIVAQQNAEFEEDNEPTVVNYIEPETAEDIVAYQDAEFEFDWDDNNSGDNVTTNSIVPPLTPQAKPTQPTVNEDKTKDVVVNGTTETEANPEFQNPVPPPPAARAEPVDNRAGAQSDGQGNFVYNGVEFSANTQAAYDNYIKLIDSNRPSIVEDYDPYYNAKVQRRVSVSRSGKKVDKILGAYDSNGDFVSFPSGNQPENNLRLLDARNRKIEADKNIDPFFRFD